MITEDYVSFETAKLLKEKGFDESISMVYMSYGDLCKLHRYDRICNSNYNDITKNYFEYTAPTIQMARKWLRRIHNVNIDIVTIWNQKRFEYQVFIVTPENANYCYVDDKLYLDYEEACEVAIKYCLEHLI